MTVSPFHGKGYPSFEAGTTSGAVTQQTLPALETASSVKSPFRQLPSAAQLSDQLAGVHQYTLPSFSLLAPVCLLPGKHHVLSSAG